MKRLLLCRLVIVVLGTVHDLQLKAKVIPITRAEITLGENMCGRFTLVARAADVAEFLEAEHTELDWEPRYNIAPSQSIVTCRLEEEKRELANMRWGLIPSWAKDPSTGFKAINAKAETITEKPFFRAAFKKRRCLIPASGFYEWKDIGKQKQPYYIHPDKLFGFAGLWEAWDKGEEPITSCTIITTIASAAMKGLHDRMPAILPPEAFGAWLDPQSNQEELLELLRPSMALSMYTVGTAVGNVKNQGPQLIEPLAS